MFTLATLNRIMRRGRFVLAVALFAASAAVFVITARNEYHRFYGDPRLHPEVRAHLAELEELDAALVKERTAEGQRRP